MLRTSSIFSNHKSETVLKKDSAQLTRFQQSVELNGYAAELQKLRNKNIELKYIANVKGAQSNEYVISILMDHIITIADIEITKFNQIPVPSDHYLDVNDMLTLAKNIRPYESLSTDKKIILNSMENDKHYLRNSALTLGILSLPVVPFFIFGAGLTAVCWTFTGLIAIPVANDFLKSIKAIDEDTESKKIVESYIETIVKTHLNLNMYINDNKYLHDQLLENTSSIRLT